jgi:hypothetical protein
MKDLFEYTKYLGCCLGDGKLSELGGKHDTQVTRTLPGIKGGLGNMTITEASPAWQVPSTTASGTA